MIGNILFIFMKGPPLINVYGLHCCSFYPISTQAGKTGTAVVRSQAGVSTVKLAEIIN